MYRILVSRHSVEGNRVIVEDPDQLHHLRNVLRIQPGQSVECFDGEGAGYLGCVIQSEPRSVVVEINQRVEESQRAVSVTLVQSLIKPNRFEWCLQKAAELGVDRVVPLMTERTVVRPQVSSFPARHHRWRRILEEASKQCRRYAVPELADITDLRTFLSPDVEGSVLIPTLLGQTQSLKKVLQSPEVKSPITVLVGPEGDFTKDEVQYALDCQAQAVSLGDLTMRSETAGIALLSILQYEFSKG